MNKPELLIIDSVWLIYNPTFMRKYIIMKTKERVIKCVYKRGRRLKTRLFLKYHSTIVS